MSSIDPTPAPTGVDACAVDSAGSMVPLGIFLGLLGSVAINTGNNVQCLGMQKLQEKAEKEYQEKLAASSSPEEAAQISIREIPPAESRIWVIGTTIFLSGSFLNFGSYAFAASNLLAPLESIQFVTNILFAKFMIGTTISQKKYIGTALIIIGTVFTCVFADQRVMTLGVQELMEKYENPGYIAYIIILLIFGVSIQICHLHYQKCVDEGRPLPNSESILPFTYAMSSALFGTQSVVQAKCLAELLESHALCRDKDAGFFGTQSDDENCEDYIPIFSHWFLYATLLVWAAFVVVWLYRMNEALSKYDPLFIIPLLQSNFIFFAVLSGGIYFEEFNCFEIIQWVGFTVGIVVNFMGLYQMRPETDSIVPIEGGAAEEGSLSPSPDGSPVTSQVEREKRKSSVSKLVREGHIPTPTKVLMQVQPLSGAYNSPYLQQRQIEVSTPTSTSPGTCEVATDIHPFSELEAEDISISRSEDGSQAERNSLGDEVATNASSIYDEGLET